MRRKFIWDKLARCHKRRPHWAQGGGAVLLDIHDHSYWWRPYCVAIKL